MQCGTEGLPSANLCRAIANFPQGDRLDTRFCVLVEAFCVCNDLMPVAIMVNEDRRHAGRYTTIVLDYGTT